MFLLLPRGLGGQKDKSEVNYSKASPGLYEPAWWEQLEGDGRVLLVSCIFPPEGLPLLPTPPPEASTPAVEAQGGSGEAGER